MAVTIPVRPVLPQSRPSSAAVLAMVLCLIPITLPVGLVLAAITLLHIRRQPDRSGRGLIMIGLATAAGYVALTPIMLFLLAGCGGKSESAKGGKDSGGEDSGQVVRVGGGGPMEAARRAQCASNLRGMANVIMVYRANNNDSWPALYPGQKIDSTKTGIENSIDTQASLWLLVMNRNAPEMFVCPSDDAVAFKATPDYDQPFPTVNSEGIPTPNGRRSWSYSYQIPNGVGSPSRYNPRPTRFAVLADRAPAYHDLMLVSGVSSADEARKALASATPADSQRINSPNHFGKGQNVLYQDGHSEWRTDPWCGINDDNIYTWATGEKQSERLIGRKAGSAAGISDLPFDDDDSVLVNVLHGVPCK